MTTDLKLNMWKMLTNYSLKLKQLKFKDWFDVMILTVYLALIIGILFL